MSRRSGPAVILVRHGETEWSRTGQHTGNVDIPLTEEGRAAAARLRPALAAWSFAHVLSSPLVRALETCRLSGLAEEPELVDDLREWHYGEDEGRTTAEIREERPGWTVWDGPLGGETVDALAGRLDRVVARLRALDGPVAVVGHGHALRVLAARWLELAPLEGRRLVLDTGSISVLGWERETPALRSWNLRVAPR